MKSSRPESENAIVPGPSPEASRFIHGSREVISAREIVRTTDSSMLRMVTASVAASAVAYRPATPAAATAELPVVLPQGVETGPAGAHGAMAPKTAEVSSIRCTPRRLRLNMDRSSLVCRGTITGQLQSTPPAHRDQYISAVSPMRKSRSVDPATGTIARARTRTASGSHHPFMRRGSGGRSYSTVTLLARFRGLSTSCPRSTAAWYAMSWRGMTVSIGLRASGMSGT
ncbi:MAG: hypothetical protein GIKADHBN_00979 [Phycisphaerales bacterium]|nr:hypothetical protein [Phycisphaerales bacterium]